MKVFDATWSGAARLPGVPRLRILYEAQLLTGGLADWTKIDQWAAGVSGLACLDIECWPVGYRAYQEAQVSASVAALSAVLERAKRSGQPFGYFAMPPNAHYAVASPSLLPAYQAACAYLAPVLMASDAIFLEGYFWWDDLRQWRAALALAAAEARRYGKPVYAFLWDHGLLGKNVALPIDVITAQLAFCADLLDGVVWWSPSGQATDLSAAWWPALQAYL